MVSVSKNMILSTVWSTKKSATGVGSKLKWSHSGVIPAKSPKESTLGDSDSRNRCNPTGLPVFTSRYPGLVLRHLERERGGQKKGPNTHQIDGMGPSKFQKRGGINQGKVPSKGCAYKLAPQRHLVLVDRRGLMSGPRETP